MPTPTHVLTSEHEIPMSPPHGFGPPVSATTGAYGVVMGVVCQAQFAPPSTVFITCA